MGDYLNDEKAAKVLFDSKELMEQPNRRACFSNLEEYDEFWFEDWRLEKSTGSSHESGAVIEGSCTKSEFDKIAEAMQREPQGAGAQNKARKPQPKAKAAPESREAKEMRESHATRKVLLGRLKNLYEKVRRECKDMR